MSTTPKTKSCTAGLARSSTTCLLEAERLGIGTLWIANTCFAYPELTESINGQGQLIGAVALGYADEAPRQRPRKMLDDIVEYRY